MNPDAHILIVEDDEDDAYFMRRALKTAAPGVTYYIATDGRMALEYLRGGGPFFERTRFPHPALMFMDLKLPYLNGLQVLEIIRQDATLKTLPVFILTSSSEERDRDRAQALGIERYLVKPPTPEMLHEIFSTMVKSGESPMAGTMGSK